MIFLSGFTHSIIVKDYKHKRRAGQFLEEYKWLLRSIEKYYPEATAVLYNFEGIINISELKAIHQKTLVFNWNNKFKDYLGIDLNLLLALQSAIELFNDDIVMIDPDCLVVKRFDELLNDDVDITVATRGPVSWNGMSHNVIFAPAIYHKKRTETVQAYISHLYVKGYKYAVLSKDYWSNVQASVNKILLSAGMKLEVDFNGFPPEYGEVDIGDCRIKIKSVAQYILSYPIQDEKYYPETCIIHYKNYRNRNTPADVYRDWVERKEA